MFRGGGVTPRKKNWVGVCEQLPKTPTLFMNKICDIPYPIHDLTKNSKPYLWPESYIKTLFPTSVTINSLVQTNVKHNLAFVAFLFDNDEKVASS